MKRIIQAVVVATLFIGTQAKAEDPMIVVPSAWTYADKHASEGGAVNAFAGSIDEMIVLNSQGERSAGSAKVADAFPGSAREDIVTVASKSTYADRFAAHAAAPAQGH